MAKSFVCGFFDSRCIFVFIHQAGSDINNNSSNYNNRKLNYKHLIKYYNYTPRPLNSLLCFHLYAVHFHADCGSKFAVCARNTYPDFNGRVLGQFCV